MALDIVGYRAKNNNGENVPVLVPRWSERILRNAGRFPSLATLIQTYPDFPLEATWFVASAELKANAELLGIPNVWNVRELADNNEKWVFDEDGTKYITFSYSSNISNIVFHWTRPSGSTTSASASLTDYNVSDTDRIRATSMISDTVVPDTQYPGRWTISNINPDNFYFAGTTYAPASAVMSNIMEFWDGLEPVIEPSDPYAPGGESGTGGGTGDFDGSSDAIPIPDLPTLSATSTGFITLFNPTSTQLRALANYMWSNSLFDLDTWKKIFADPMDAILGLSIVPVAVPSGGSSPVSVGNIATDVSMTTAAAQYVAVDCGTLNINEYWGAYLDYEPFTKAEIYLPYIGTHAISVDDIMGKAVHVVYHVDILSGACAAYVQCGESVLYTFIGQCASSIPITGNDWTNVINGVLSAAASIGSMVATGGASAPLAVPALASTAVNGMKPSIEKSGSLAGTGGMLGVQTPYIILTRPRQCLPSNQNSYMGYPSFIGASLGDLSGYTEIESVHLDGITATDSEISEIETLLKGGVIF